MEIKLINDYEGMFFFACDGAKDGCGDQFVNFFTTYEEALDEAYKSWDSLSEFDKKGRRMYVAVSNTEVYPDCNPLTDSEHDFIELSKEEIMKNVNRYEMRSSSEKEFENYQKKILAEKKLEQQKIKHREEMESRNKMMNALKDSDDMAKCLYWRDHHYFHPSGDDIVRIKKETGLSWSAFKHWLKMIDK